MFAIFLANKKAEVHTYFEYKVSFQPLSDSTQVRVEAQKRCSKKC